MRNSQVFSLLEIAASSTTTRNVKIFRTRPPYSPRSSLMKNAYLALLLSFLLCGWILDAQERQTICLNMIVKNERHVIKRCLDSVKPFIDHWVIVDTGSTDGTQEEIKSFMKEVPGELYERPWKNFGENRNEALQLAKGKSDYILFMDADDYLEYAPSFALPHLKAGLYKIWRVSKGGSSSFQNHQMVRSDLPWRWVGVVHEYLECDVPYTSELLEHITYVIGGDGASHKDPKKFQRYAKLLEEGLKKEPNNSRYVFYLAESYRFAGDAQKAIDWYEKRISIGGWAEEIFWSMFQIASLKKEIGRPTEEVISSYYRAHRYRPHRVEPIYHLAELYNQRGDFSLAYTTIKSRAYIPKPPQKDVLFNMDWMEQYGLLFQLSICSYYLGHYQESLNACDILLSLPHVPNHIRKQTQSNRSFPLQKLGRVASEEKKS